MEIPKVLIIIITMCIITPIYLIIGFILLPLDTHIYQKILRSLCKQYMRFIDEVINV